METTNISSLADILEHDNLRSVKSLLNVMLIEYASVEHNYHKHPSTAMTNLRTFAELLVKSICILENINDLETATQHNRNKELFKLKIINEEQFKQLENIRRLGNKEAHGDKSPQLDISRYAAISVNLICWFLEKYTGSHMVIPVFIPPVVE